MRIIDRAKETQWQARAITICFMLFLFLCALFFMHTKPEAIYLALPDIGHQLIPNIRTTCGNCAPYIWWVGSFSEEVYAVILMLVIAIKGKGKKWGIAFAIVAVMHAICWHFTVLPTPPDILWQFPFRTGQVPMSDDFWFSGHVGAALLLVLYTQNKTVWIRIAGYLYLIFIIWLVLATRTHYSIDILGALFATYVIYILVNKYL